MIKTVAFNLFALLFKMFFQDGSHCVLLAGLELTLIHPPLAPECWD